MNKNNLANGIKVLLFAPMFAFITSAWLRVVGIDPRAAGANMDDSTKTLLAV